MNTHLIEQALAAIEQSATDITGGYNSWRDIGFALSEEFGEAGRSYFHRVSRFGPTYDAKECDLQYQRCLDSKGSGIGFGTFMHYLKAAGIRLETALPEQEKKAYRSGGLGDFPASTPAAAFALASDQEEEEEQALGGQQEDLPDIPESVYDNLPLFLKKVVAHASNEVESDILLLGALASLSACLPNVYGIYDGRKVFSNLYLFITAPASGGKGRLDLCKHLVMPLHQECREQVKLLKEEYEKQLALYNANKNNMERPIKPQEKMLFIPANNSATGAFQLLHDNNGKGLIFETEGDTIGFALKSEFGNYSDGLRKAWHHENISYFRRTDKEYVDIERPTLSAVLSGTPGQIAGLIPTAENGLFSRFIFYYMKLDHVWKDVFSDYGDEGIEERFQVLGLKFHAFSKQLNNLPSMKVVLSESQKIRFNRYFSRLQLAYLNLQSEDYTASIRRLGLICYRFCMIFSALRGMEDGILERVRECDERDFMNAMMLVAVLVKHNSSVYYRLPKEKQPLKRPNRKERFLERLPVAFKRSDYYEIADLLQIPRRTSEKYIDSFISCGLIHKDKKNLYLNPGVGPDQVER